MNFSTPGVCCMLGVPCAKSVLRSLIGLTSFHCVVTPLGLFLSVCQYVDDRKHNIPGITLSLLINVITATFSSTSAIVYRVGLLLHPVAVGTTVTRQYTGVYSRPAFNWDPAFIRGLTVVVMQICVRIGAYIFTYTWSSSNRSKTLTLLLSRTHVFVNSYHVTEPGHRVTFKLPISGCWYYVLFITKIYIVNPVGSKTLQLINFN